VVSSADLVVSAVGDDAALLDIVFQAGGLKETLDVSQIFVEINTVSPSASRRVAEAMSAIGVGYIRSPVSGSTALAAQGALTAVISGPAGALASLKDFYAAFTRKTFVVGGGEEARYLKLVLNSLVGGTSALLAKALGHGS
jgi:3-hydroxyisobutyrate dehydrogenase-like beta-hydroxyacid dehydrogenase